MLYALWSKGSFYITCISLLLFLHTAGKHHSVVLAATVGVKLCFQNCFCHRYGYQMDFGLALHEQSGPSSQANSRMLQL